MVSNARMTRWRRWFPLLVGFVCVVGLAIWWWLGRNEVSTNNVYVVGNITPIASDVGGLVVALFVDDNMIVQPGDPIAQIDPVEFQIAVDQALADYQQASHSSAAADLTARYTTDDRKSLLDAAVATREEAEQGVRAAEVAVQTRIRLQEKDQEILASLKAQLPGQEALRRNAQYYYERFKSLSGSGDVPVQEFDNREAAYREAIAKVASLQSDIQAAGRQVLASELQLQESRVRLELSRKTLANAVAGVGRAAAEQLQPLVAADTAQSLHSRQALAEAKLRQAKLNLSNTFIRAPRAGIIGRRTIQVGQTLEAHKPFLSIVPIDMENIWVVANLREEQMRGVRVGQAARIAIDAIPERTFDGYVESVAGGTGTVFSTFPPDNATGNFVRVVQRLPIRIRFIDVENYHNRIRPGMSSTVAIDLTRSVRGGIHEW